MIEPEWTEAYRNLVLGLALHDRELCSGCHLHSSVLADSSLHLSLVDTYCEMCKAKDRHTRRIEGRDADYEKKHTGLAPAAPRPNDGLHVRLKSLTPAEVAERKKTTRRGTDG